MIEIVECLDARGRSPYRDWFSSLDSQGAVIVAMAIERLADGNTSRVKAIGEGAAEIRIDRGPGYRVYFGWPARRWSSCSAAAPSAGRQRDIADALTLWRLYKARKVGVRKKQ